MTATISVLVVDDEPLGRTRLQDLIAHTSDLQLAGVATNGREAISAIHSLEPRLVLLDVQMPGMSGLDVIQEVGPDRMPATILVTAYDQFALKAFDAAAVDYLLKPFSDERFEAAIRRVRQIFSLQQRADQAVRLQTALRATLGVEMTGPVASVDGASYLQRIAVESPGQVRVVRVDDIDYISASGVYAELHVGDRTYIVRERMQSLEERLDPRRFFRTHRSAIVQLDRIELLVRQAGGDYTLKLRNHSQLSVSRNRVRQLEAWMGVSANSSS